ncbi:MAG: glycosyltransferase family 4 protein [Lentisphaeria bacterium]|nr:glycosyltransferase family 4 protein [Lentisphaeria bacterium]
MRITWVTRSFLDYRIPVFQELASYPDVDFTLITSSEIWATPKSVQEKTKQILREKVIFLSGEKCIGKPYSPDQESNSVRRIHFQPGLINEIMKTEPDVVITDAFNHWTLPVFWLRMLRKFKHIVCYERTAHTERNAGFLKRRFISTMRHFLDAVHYNGVLCHDFLRSLKYPESKLRFGNMSLGVKELEAQIKAIPDEEIFSFRKSLGIKKEQTVFLFIGGLIERKGLRHFLPAWKYNKEGAVLLIVGKGSQEEELKKYCQENKIDNVIFAGSHPYDKIPLFCKISDIFVLPTLEDNWSLVVPEAMACGLPVMTSIYNGCYPELIKNENGWLFDPLDTANVKQILDDVMNSKTLLKKMGAASQTIVKEFSPEIIVGGIYKTCKDLLSKDK